MDVDDELAKLRLKERVRYWFNSGVRDYAVLLNRVFPGDRFPNARRCSSNGGPPGCAMALGRALRELGILRDQKTNELSATW